MSRDPDSVTIDVVLGNAFGPTSPVPVLVSTLYVVARSQRAPVSWCHGESGR